MCSICVVDLRAREYWRNCAGAMPLMHTFAPFHMNMNMYTGDNAALQMLDLASNPVIRLPPSLGMLHETLNKIELFECDQLIEPPAPILEAGHGRMMVVPSLIFGEVEGCLASERICHHVDTVYLLAMISLILACDLPEPRAVMPACTPDCSCVTAICD
jgi:hypothetical protein